MPISAPPSRNLWPLLLATLGVLFVVLTVWSLICAQIPGRAVVPAYAAQHDKR